MDIQLRNHAKGLCATCDKILNMNCFKVCYTESHDENGFNVIHKCSLYNDWKAMLSDKE